MIETDNYQNEIKQQPRTARTNRCVIGHENHRFYFTELDSLFLTCFIIPYCHPCKCVKLLVIPHGCYNSHEPAYTSICDTAILNPFSLATCSQVKQIFAPQVEHWSEFHQL